MKNKTSTRPIENLEAFAQHADYSLLETLQPDPQATDDGSDHDPRQVFSGHYVPVTPTPIANPRYVAHSKAFFKELGLSDALATSEPFMRMFSGDVSNLPEPLRPHGWATGYALSIYGTELYEQCPFGTGNGYGDGRAVSIFEGVLNGKRWEMQLKGGGRTPYCRGADGRAVLRSSVREFLAQEHMHALGVPTTRSLTLYTSTTETVKRPWFREGSHSRDPEVMIDEPVAITTRVASSFLRVGQLELFGRRARKGEHPKAMEELEAMVRYIIAREYSKEVDTALPLAQQAVQLAHAFGKRLSTLVANWIRVGYCQGNFNSDNCAVGGFTLDYGPFGFMDAFDPYYQPWTGGGRHFSFLNQPKAAEQNFKMFCLALRPLLENDQSALAKLEETERAFPAVMHSQMLQMWAVKLGLQTFDAELFNELMRLMIETSVDYTIFFRELSDIPDDIAPLVKSFYANENNEALLQHWREWLDQWRSAIDADTPELRAKLLAQMKQSNPKYTLREWILVPAYKAAQGGDYSLIEELMEVMSDPYAEQSEAVEDKYYRKKPADLFDIAGVSHVSCSS